jgi:hypothetical protein
MNYSTYFENKVATVLSNKINLTVIKIQAKTHLEFIQSTGLFDTFNEVYAFVAHLDPFNFEIKGNNVTVKVMEYGE